MTVRAFSWLLGGLFLIAASFPGPVMGQGTGALPATGLDTKPIGKVQSVTGSVTIEHAGAVVVQATAGVGQAKVDDPVYRGDVVQTGADGAVAIIFGDGTSFNVAKNARMEINDFVYDPKSSANSSLFNLTKGTFTFLAGKTAKNGNMKVETPVGTMGIRGTAPHVEISNDGTVRFTTLIEDGEATRAAPKQPPPRQASPPKRVPNMNICRNC